MNEQEILVATEEYTTELVDSIGVPMPGEREALKFPHLSAKCSKVFQSCKSCPEFLQSAKSKTRERSEEHAVTFPPNRIGIGNLEMSNLK